MIVSQKILLWTPRIILIIFAAFLMLFSLDILSEGYSLWEGLAGFLIHNIPTLFIIATLVIGWRWPLYGGIGCLVIALGFVFFFGVNRIVTFLILITPLLIAGGLFIWKGKRKKRLEF